MIYYFVEGERENGERSSLRYPTAFAVGTVIIKATVAVLLLAQKYIFSMALLLHW
jgi:hypothetical protein